MMISEFKHFKSLLHIENLGYLSDLLIVHASFKRHSLDLNRKKENKIQKEKHLSLFT